MINWNDIQVEQEIAQERYRMILEERKQAQSQRGISTRNREAGAIARLRNWLGAGMINLGCQVKVTCEAV